MKIISWNIERPNKNQISKIKFIEDLIAVENPDLLILTETNRCVNFEEQYFELHSETLPTFHENQNYFEGENRVSIYSKFPFKNEVKTYDSFTSICGLVETNFGELIVYGSIIGSFGGKGLHFENDLEKQKNDLENLKGNLCFSGDLNISFSGWKYPSAKVIDETKSFFELQNLEILTENYENNAIHTIMSKDLLNGKKISTKMIEIDRKISDHNMIICEIQK
ncbi:endonuclease/exonuclease/phosphatase family protein [Chryseobacterium luquanense]|uniref:Endonuclease/exonuclease/phosphatase family protein n=1 Tax=Chryseobacterium luquanense TaxID=2983766 RepID=A0ABT3XZ47_9FLAO|nr:endonuclease/exonuclease/phosphatase family protein [Chryseobacterium luquanense]MCX8531122.1 endonuclease/exonuclease/phosphatase family protein [Chryseobacterium luquanense]